MFRNIAAMRHRGLMAGAAVTAVLACGIGAAAGAGVQINPFGTSHVGTQADGSVLLPSSQRIAPFGQRTKFTSEAVDHAISPDGTKVAVQTWVKTVAQPRLSGSNAERDSTNPAQLNRYGYYATTNWTKPYPGDKKILTPDEVPGRNTFGNLSGE